MNNRRRSLSAAAAVVLVLSLAMPSATLAASRGGCTNGGSNQYHSGEYATATRNGISASIAVGYLAVFGGCTPDDNNGTNAASANINIHYLNAWLETGVMACNSTDHGEWPAGLCDGGRHWFIEQHGQAPWDYTMWDMGQIANGAYTYSIIYYTSLSKYRVSLNSFYSDVDMGAGLNPNNSNGYDWQVETQDGGDGLGTISDAANVGQMKTLSGTTWVNHAVNTCDRTDAQHHCVPNGTYAYYAYTTN